MRASAEESGAVRGEVGLLEAGRKAAGSDGSVALGGGGNTALTSECNDGDSVVKERRGRREDRRVSLRDSRPRVVLPEGAWRQARVTSQVSWVASDGTRHP